MIFVEDNLIVLATRNTTYIIKIENGIVEHLYYGSALNDLRNIKFLALNHNRNLAIINKNYGVDLSSLLLETSFFDVGDFKNADFIISDSYNVNPQDFVFKEYKIFNGRPSLLALPHGRNADDVKTLQIEYYSKTFDTSVKTYYSVYESIDIISRYAVIQTNRNNVKIEKAFSASLNYSNENFKMLTLGGVYGRERLRHIQKIPFGKTEISSMQGCSSHSASPCAIIADLNTDENIGRAYGLQLVYSGNFSLKTDLDDYGKLRIQIGINNEHFEYNLKPVEEFYTPEAILTYSDLGYNGISINFSDYIRDNLMPEKFAKENRPIVINTWEAFDFNINHQKLDDFANIAKKIGVDTLVIDDGWFSSRRNDSSGLGDWYVSNEVFPNGLKDFSDSLTKKGLRLGLWIEPEMVNPNSDLFRNHPDWVLGTNDNTLSRNQLVLDFTNPSVVDYIFESLINVFDEINLAYVKWDFNRYISPYISCYTKNSKEIAYKYMLGVYDLLNRLTKRYVNVVFETCAGGGGRFDAGMLAFSPQIWTSDNTDAFERCYIQAGASYFYPCSSMSCHVAQNNGGTKLSPDLDFVFSVALNGVLGYELNLFNYSEKDVEEINRQIQVYKSVQDLMLSGDFYRLKTPFDEHCHYAFSFVSKNKNRALVVFNVLFNFANANDVYLKIYGLDDNKTYQIDNNIFLTGKVLRKKGLLIPLAQKSGQSFRFYLEAI